MKTVTKHPRVSFTSLDYAAFCQEMTLGPKTKGLKFHCFDSSSIWRMSVFQLLLGQTEHDFDQFVV